jgi:hypothetical protein
MSCSFIRLCAGKQLFPVRLGWGQYFGAAGFAHVGKSLAGSVAITFSTYPVVRSFSAFLARSIGSWQFSPCVSRSVEVHGTPPLG